MNEFAHRPSLMLPFVLHLEAPTVEAHFLFCLLLDNHNKLSALLHVISYYNLWIEYLYTNQQKETKQKMKIEQVGINWG